MMPETNDFSDQEQGQQDNLHAYDDMPMTYNLPAGEIMGESLNVYFGNFFKYSLLSAIAFLPLVIWGIWLFWSVDLYDFTGIKNMGYQIAAIGLVSAFFQSIAVGAVIYGVFKQKSGQGVSFTKCLTLALSKMHKLIGVTIVIMLGAAFVFLPFVLGIFIPVLGALLLICGIIPILMFITATYLAPAVVMVESKGVFESIKRSFDLTKNNRSKIFAILLVFGLVNKVVDYILNMILDTGGPAQTMESMLQNAQMSMWLDMLVRVFFASLGAVAVALVYHRMRSKLEGLSDMDLASLFD